MARGRLIGPGTFLVHYVYFMMWIFTTPEMTAHFSRFIVSSALIECKLVIVVWLVMNDVGYREGL